MPDIVQRQASSDGFRKLEAPLRQVLDFTPQLVAVFGPNHERIYANRAALDHRGLGLDKWREAHTVHPVDQDRVRAYAQGASLTGSPYDLELRLSNGQGHYRGFLASYRPLHDDQGQIKYWYVALTDIEDHKQAGDRLYNENVALREEIDQTSMFEEIVGTASACA